MKKFLCSALGGTLLGVLLTTQIAGPMIAEEAKKSDSVYEQLDLFGEVFERIRSQYVEVVDPKKLVEAAINGMLTVGRGQRIGLFAGTGVGKSVLLGMMARYTKADVIVVGLIGERGREVKEFIEDILGEEGRARSVVVAAPAMIADKLFERFGKLARLMLGPPIASGKSPHPRSQQTTVQRAHGSTCTINTIQSPRHESSSFDWCLNP